jgi:hypothetical protein
MGWIGGDGAQGTLLVLMGWVFGNLFVGDDRLLGIISGVIFLRAQRSAFGMIFGLGIELLKRLFLACLILPISRRHLLRIMWSDPMELSNGIYSFLG